MPPLTHYTEEPAKLSATSDSAYTRVQGGGFVTRDMLEQTITELRKTSVERRTRAMLVDLREVAGYESDCLQPAHQFLHEAASLGVRRIAVVASSSVMRTASRVAASSLSVELRIFEHEPSAEHWLAPPRRRITETAPIVAR